jgi:predicted PurR-regulated permease PerM
VGLGLGLGALALLVYLLRGVLTPLFFALLIAYVLDPLVDRLERLRIPRAAAIAIVLAAALGTLSLFVFLVVPGIVRDVGGFLRDLPGQAQAALGRLERWAAELGVPVPHSVAEAIAEWELDAQTLATKLIAPAGTVIGTVIGGTASALGRFAAALIVPVVAFYLLYDFDRMKAAIVDLVPPRVRPYVVDVGREIDQTLGQFIRGQLTVMSILGALYATAFSVLGVRLAVPIGIVGGVLSFIPYVGGATALALAVLMALLDFTGWGKVLGVVAAYTLVQTIDGLFITPRVLGGKVGLPAVWVLVALLVGSELFGFLGVLLAVPGAAVVKIFVMRAVRYYKHSRFFAEKGPEDLGVVPSALLTPVPPPFSAAGEASLASIGAVVSARTASDASDGGSGSGGAGGVEGRAAHGPGRGAMDEATATESVSNAGGPAPAEGDRSDPVRAASERSATASPEASRAGPTSRGQVEAQQGPTGRDAATREGSG